MEFHHQSIPRIRYQIPPRLLIDIYGAALQSDVPSSVSGTQLVDSVRVLKAGGDEDGTVQLEALLKSDVTYDASGTSDSISFYLHPLIPMKEIPVADITGAEAEIDEAASPGEAEESTAEEQTVASSSEDVQEQPQPRMNIEVLPVNNPG